MKKVVVITTTSYLKERKGDITDVKIFDNEEDCRKWASEKAERKADKLNGDYSVKEWDGNALVVASESMPNKRVVYEYKALEGKK